MFSLFFRSLPAKQVTKTLVIFVSMPLPESHFPPNVTGFNNKKCKQLHLSIPLKIKHVHSCLSLPCFELTSASKELNFKKTGLLFKTRKSWKISFEAYICIDTEMVLTVLNKKNRTKFNFTS